MARTELQPPFSAPISTGAGAAAADPFFDLGRLLSRLEQNILRADGARWHRLVNDEFQRLQARFDVAAARTLLARVEQTAPSTMKGHARRQAMQAELNRRRMVVERLQERLDDLDEEARAAAALEGDDDDDEANGSGNEDNEGDSTLDPSLAHILQQQKQQQQLAATTTQREAEAASTSTETEEGLGGDKAAGEPTTAASSAPTPTLTPTPTTQQQPAPQATTTTTATTTTLRPRRSRRIAGKGTTSSRSPPSRIASIRSATAAHTTSADVRSTNELRTSLLGGHDDGAGDGALNAVANEEVALDHHRREQEALSEDILRLARALKEKSLTTARLLEDDKDVVDRVGEGLHSTNETLAAASRGMAALTRMTEGKGFLGRLMLYGMVYGLMLVLVLLFLFLPKLRL